MTKSDRGGLEKSTGSEISLDLPRTRTWNLLMTTMSSVVRCAIQLRQQTRLYQHVKTHKYVYQFMLPMVNNQIILEEMFGIRKTVVHV